jgi:RNA polymerase sigma factor (sigma-70 family)
MGGHKKIVRFPPRRQPLAMTALKDDAALLRCYVVGRSEPAFAELVQRHVGLVYSVALRRVGGDAHLAEDVAQKVFCDLARKASTLTGRATLSGWLYVSTHVASAAVVRSEQRRKRRETEAHTMQTMLSSSESEADWTRLRPVIDDAIIVLRDEEREAIALRFFEKRSFAEVGAALRVTEEAARKRVDRALDKLRAALTRRGITSTTAALGLALTTIGAGPAPAELGAKVATQAFASASVPAGGSVVAAVLNASLPAAAVLVLGGLLLGLQRQANGRLRAELTSTATEQEAITTLRAENQQLARRIAQADELRGAAATRLSTPRPNATATRETARPIAATINITAAGTIAWNNDLVSLTEFISRLQTLQTANPEARVHVLGLDTSFGALSYIIDEARKAQIQHLTVEGNATPDPKFESWWF